MVMDSYLFNPLYLWPNSLPLGFRSIPLLDALPDLVPGRRKCFVQRFERRLNIRREWIYCAVFALGEVHATTEGLDHKFAQASEHYKEDPAAMAQLRLP